MRRRDRPAPGKDGLLLNRRLGCAGAGWGAGRAAGFQAAAAEPGPRRQVRALPSERARTGGWCGTRCGPIASDSDATNVAAPAPSIVNAPADEPCRGLLPAPSRSPAEHLGVGEFGALSRRQRGSPRQSQLGARLGDNRDRTDSSTRADNASRSCSAPTITTPPGCQELRSKRAVNHSTRRPGPPDNCLMAVCGSSSSRPSRRSSIRRPTRTRRPGHSRRRERSPGRACRTHHETGRDNIVETGIGQRLQKQCRFRGRIVAPARRRQREVAGRSRRLRPAPPARPRWPVPKCGPPPPGARRIRHDQGWFRRRHGPPPGPSRLTSMSATAQVRYPNLHLNRGPMPERRNQRPAVKALVRERRKDRDSVVSSVYPGEPTRSWPRKATGDRHLCNHARRVQSRAAAKCCHE